MANLTSNFIFLPKMPEILDALIMTGLSYNTESSGCFLIVMVQIRLVLLSTVLGGTSLCTHKVKNTHTHLLFTEYWSISVSVLISYAKENQILPKDRGWES